MTTRILTAADVLKRYVEDENMFEFAGGTLTDVNQRGIDGDTPLHFACWRASLDEAVALIEGGADVNAVGDMGQSPLHVALTMGSLELTEVLLKNGAAVDRRDEFGMTPQMLADASGKEGLRQLLREVHS